MIGLFGVEDLAADAGVPLTGGGSPPMSLAQIVATEDEVRAALDAAARPVAPSSNRLSTPNSAGTTGTSPIRTASSGRSRPTPGWTEAADGTVTLVPITLTHAPQLLVLAGGRVELDPHAARQLPVQGGQQRGRRGHRTGHAHLDDAVRPSTSNALDVGAGGVA